jgi:outer membrane protein OmpU
MRKILLAGVAAVGALALGAPASAQVQTTPSGWSPAQGSANPNMQNTPGVTVRFGGRYNFYATNTQSDINNNSSTTTPFGSTKVSSLDFFDYARIYPGFDAMTAGGLRYGAGLEVRMSDNSTARGNSRGLLTYRRINAYVATPTLGMVRVGTANGAVAAMGVGHIMGSIATGLWDGDGPTSVIGPANPATFWYSSSNVNNNTKISYFSPQFFGFDAGVSYAPNNGNFEGSACGVGQLSIANGGANCDRLSESNLDSQTQRPRNIYELMLRFRGTFAGVGLAASGGYVGSDTVGASGNAFATEGLSLFVGGATASIIGITVGGVVTGGKANYASQARTLQTTGLTPGNTTASYGAFTVLPSGVGAADLFTWQLGASYAIGPFTVGAAYHEAKYEGNVAVGSDAKDKGFGIGGSYALAPGIVLFAEYLYGTREEAGVSLRTGAAGGSDNKATSNVFLLGTQLNW